MIQVKLNRDHGVYEEGDVIYTTRNEAHGLIEQGVAKLFKAPKDKMMKPEKKRSGYKIK